MNIPVANVTVGSEEAKAVSDVVNSGWLSMGKIVKEFEESFSKKVKARHSIAVNNGTAALHVALAALGIKAGDEVIIPSLTFISTANAVLYQNAKPVLVECDPETYNITAEIIESAITKKTRAIIPVDMNGMPCDYDQIIEVAERHGIPLVWDSAESLGAMYKNRDVGSIADIHIFSFFPNKNVTTGEGGMICTRDDKLNEKIRVLRNQGQDYRYHHIEIGFNYRMTEVAAAIGIEQLKKLDKTVEDKQRIAEIYNKAFAKTRLVHAPFVPDYVSAHSWYMYAIKVDKDRDAIVEKLKQKGIDTRLSFPPIHSQLIYMKKYGFREDSLPVTWRAWKQLIDIPIWPGLDAQKQKYIIETLLEQCEEK
ncbi:MAG: DegT/DnrJ/EryC1/StrS family aminotransferase [Candidatus Woesearchaeota archaeon]